MILTRESLNIRGKFYPPIIPLDRHTIQPGISRGETILVYVRFLLCDNATALSSMIAKRLLA